MVDVQPSSPPPSSLLAQRSKTPLAMILIVPACSLSLILIRLARGVHLDYYDTHFFLMFEQKSGKTYAASLESILEAHERIKMKVHQTPVVTSHSLNQLIQRNLYFKCESMQKTGSFKARGALNAVLKNSYTSVATHSSGNHGQALAWAAQQVGIPAYIVMPNNSPLCKQNGVSGYGGVIRFVESTQLAREEGAKQVTQETGASLVHPFDNADVISGQGTIAVEFLSQVGQLDAIVVPLGGGGFCSGVAIAAKALKPGIKIIGAEPGTDFTDFLPLHLSRDR
jgi:threonine dehydratase